MRKTMQLLSVLFFCGFITSVCVATEVPNVIQDCKQQGLCITRYPNGQKMAEQRFQNSEKYGLWTTWHSNGKKATEGNYQGGKMHGLWSEWDDDGQKKKKPTIKMTN